MRFLNTLTYELVRDSDREFEDSNGRYAILSHRWITRPRTGPPKSEITFETLRPDLLVRFSQDPTRKSNKGEYADSMNKIIDSCAVAHRQRLKWLWIDTCCINKANAVEEGRSINSMFEWYSKATICYTFLADVLWRDRGQHPFKSIFAGQQYSVWFQRGWTLQELLAPHHMEFYDSDWKPLGTKEELAGLISSVTGIDEIFLKCGNPLQIIQTASVATRLSWMAGRVTTEPEDIAYSLLGILGVIITPQYGEGKKAFMRLQEKLIETSTDESLFAWTLPLRNQELACFRKSDQTVPKFAEERWGLLAPSPDCFERSKNVVTTGKIVPRLGGGYRWTQQGLQFQVSFKSGSEATNWAGLPRSKIDWPLNCWERAANGTLETIVLHLVRSDKAYLRDRLNNFDKSSKAKVTSNSVLGIDQQQTRSLVISQPSFN